MRGDMPPLDQEEIDYMATWRCTAKDCPDPMPNDKDPFVWHEDDPYHLHCAEKLDWYKIK